MGLSQKKLLGQPQFLAPGWQSRTLHDKRMSQSLTNQVDFHN